MAKGGRRKVGEAYVELRADSTKLGPELEKMRKDTEKTAKQAESDTNRISAGFKGVGERIEKSTEGFRKFAGAISSTIGIFTGLLGAISFVATAIIALTKNFDLFGTKAAAAIRETRDAVREMTDAVNTLNAATDKGALGAYLTGRIDELETEREGILAKGASKFRSHFPLLASLTEGAEGEFGQRFSEDERKRLRRIESQLRLLRQRGSLRFDELPGQPDSPASPGSTAQISPLDPGGQLSASSGTLQGIQEFMAKMLARLEGIERNIRDATQK